METELIWKPQPKQADALSCPAFELFYGGAKGGGKSDFLLADYLGGLKHGKDHRGIIFRRSYSELEELLARSRDIYPAVGGHYHETKRTWSFPNGATLKFRFLERDADVHKYQGHQYTWVGFDELTNWPADYCYVYMISCARSAAGVPVYVRASGNPGSVGHAWVKQRFIDDKDPGKIYTDPETELTICFIPAKLEDNLRLMTNDPEYEKRLKTLPSHLYRAYRLGDWDIFAGQVFEEFRREAHVIDPQPLDPSWIRIASLDWGYQKPFSIGWWAITGDGRMIRYREWYGCEKDQRNVGIKKAAQDVAKEAWEMSVSEGCSIMVADPACWTKIDDSPSIADKFAAAGWEMTKGNNDRKSGLSQCHDLMKLKGEDGRPMMLISKVCYGFIRTIPVLVADEKNPEDVDTTGEDHVYDETRYAAMSRYVKDPKTHPGSKYDHALDAVDWGKQGYQDFDPFEAL